MKKTALLLLTAFFVSLFTSCSDSKSRATHSKTYYDYFDTVSVISSYQDESEMDFKLNCNAVTEIFEEYHKLFDIYNEYPGINNLCTVNKNAGKEPVRIRPALLDFLVYSKEVYDKTKGEVNIAMGSVLKIWHKYRTEALQNEENSALSQLPEKALLEEARQHTDIENMVIDKTAGTVFLKDKDASLDVGALGKGYATKIAVDTLKQRGVESYVLNIGGSISAIGEKPDGGKWSVGIINPKLNGRKKYSARIWISDISVVTSGCYERYYTVDGKNYHHIIDKDTLMPSEHFASVSVITEDVALGDALSTALFCMSYEEGKTVIESFPSVEVMWITPGSVLYMTDGFKEATKKR